MNCPRCDSMNSIYLREVKVTSCRDCGLDWWWSEHDDAVVTSEGTTADEEREKAHQGERA